MNGPITLVSYTDNQHLDHTRPGSHCGPKPPRRILGVFLVCRSTQTLAPIQGTKQDMRQSALSSGPPAERLTDGPLPTRDRVRSVDG